MAIQDQFTGPISLKTICLDFEKAVWASIRTVWPHVNLHGCLFHFKQCLWRRIQKVGLKCEYRTNRPLFHVLKKLMALPNLPFNEMLGEFLRSI